MEDLLDLRNAEVYIANKNRDKSVIDALINRISSGETLDAIMIREIGEKRYIVYPKDTDAVIAHYLAGKPLKYKLLEKDDLVEECYRAALEFPTALNSSSFAPPYMDSAWIKISDLRF